MRKKERIRYLSEVEIGMTVPILSNNQAPKDAGRKKHTN